MASEKSFPGLLFYSSTAVTAFEAQSLPHAQKQGASSVTLHGSHYNVTHHTTNKATQYAFASFSRFCNFTFLLITEAIKTVVRQDYCKAGK